MDDAGNLSAIETELVADTPPLTQQEVTVTVNPKP